jgi:hypothetical protein
MAQKLFHDRDRDVGHEHPGGIRMPERMKMKVSRKFTLSDITFESPRYCVGVKWGSFGV